MYSNSDDKTCFVQLVRSRCRESSCRNKSRVTDGSNPVLLCDTHSLSLSFLLSLLLVSTSLYVMSFLPLLVSLSIRRLLTYFKLPRSTGSGPVSVFLRFLFFFFFWFFSFVYLFYYILSLSSNEPNRCEGARIGNFAMNLLFGRTRR